MDYFPRFINGVQVSHNPPAEVDRFKGMAIIILGSGLHVYEDMAGARQLLPKAHLGAVNIAALGLKPLIHAGRERLYHWFSLHPEHFILKHQYGISKAWCHTSFRKNYEDRTMYNVDYCWPVITSGTSGLFAARVALLLGYEKIVLAGVPMDGTRRFFDHPDSKVDVFATDHVAEEWQNALKQERFRDSVRSMSGRTREWLGEPTEEWIYGKFQSTNC